MKDIASNSNKLANLNSAKLQHTVETTLAGMNNWANKPDTGNNENSDTKKTKGVRTVNLYGMTWHKAFNKFAPKVHSILAAIMIIVTNLPSNLATRRTELSIKQSFQSILYFRPIH